MLKTKRECIQRLLGFKAAPHSLQESIVGKRLRAAAVVLVVLLPVGAAAFAATTGYNLDQTGEQSTAEVGTGEKAVDLPQSPLADPTVPTAPPQQQSIQAELITITPRGFEPNVIKRPAGRVLLAVVNRSERSSMTLRLERENGSALGQAQVPRNRRHWRSLVTLAAGRYRIVDANRSSVVCNIEIAP